MTKIQNISDYWFLLNYRESCLLARRLGIQQQQPYGILNISASKFCT